MRVIRFGVKCECAESSWRILHVINFFFLEQSIDVIDDVVMILLVSLFHCSSISSKLRRIIVIEIGSLIVINLGLIIIKLDFLEVNFLRLPLSHISDHLVFCRLLPLFR